MGEKGTEQEQWHPPMHAEFATLFCEAEDFDGHEPTLGDSSHRGVYVDERQWYVIDEILERIRIVRASGDVITFVRGDMETYDKLWMCLDRLKAGTAGH